MQCGKKDSTLKESLTLLTYLLVLYILCKYQTTYANYTEICQKLSKPP